MVAQVLRLRLALLVGALRGRARDRVAALGSAILLLVTTGIAAYAIPLAAEASPAAAGDLVVIGGALVVIALFVAPQLFAADDPLDPQRFAVLAMPQGRLLTLLVAVGALSPPLLAVILLTVIAAVNIGAAAVPPAAVVAGAIAAIGTCALVTRLGHALAARRPRVARSRPIAGILTMGVLGTAVVATYLAATGPWSEAVDTVAQALALTPMGAAWAWMFVADGLHVAIALVTLAVLGLLWAAAGRRLLTLAVPAGGPDRGMGWFSVMPGSAAGAIAARSMAYWLHDRRYLVNMAIVPVAALLVMIPPLVAGAPWSVVALIPAPLVALFLGWLPHDDVAYDSTAVWLHVSSGVSGAADRVGRLAPLLLFGTPLLVVVAAVSVTLAGREELMFAMLGVCAALFLSGLGLSSIASAVAPYPVTHPGDSPFRQPQRTGSSGIAAQAIVLLGALLAASPALWWGWLTLSGDPSRAWASLWGGLGVGVGVLVIGVAVGGWLFSRRGARLLELADLS
ncbi:hypothetical protein M4I32_14080 [Microbacterium sp. LRZ72]|uniref:hypothetical protein n=1 Tax=Microbacterium sp. LRZ72 TaxID=2942481 RepID=UPI0029A6D7B1|nr:hypothetical protein [Microbacterium sp. LRZ72]MDX2377923.1 hypothetical protein [Microbacterium sp. LRZ72]